DGDGFIVQAEPIGVVEEGNENAVSGGEVFEKTVLNSDLKTKASSSNLLNPKYIETGFTVQSSGLVAVNSAGVSLIGIPLSELTETFTVSGHVGNANRYYSFMDDDDLVIGVGNTNGSSKTLTFPAGATKFNMLLGSTSEDTSEARINEGSTSLPYEPFTQYLESIKDINILPEGLLTTEDIGYMDLSVLDGVNLFDKTNIFEGYG